MTTPNDVVLDTHSLLWYLVDDSRLSAAATLEFQAIGRGSVTGLIPTIVLAELLWIYERRLLGPTFDEVVSKLQTSRNFEIIPLTLGILRLMGGLAPLELHDRAIVATVLSLNSRLMTRDQAIRGMGLVNCIW